VFFFFFFGVINNYFEKDRFPLKNKDDQ